MTIFSTAPNKLSQSAVKFLLEIEFYLVRSGSSLFGEGCRVFQGLGLDFLLTGSRSWFDYLLVLPHSLICKAGISVRRTSQVALRVWNGNCSKAFSPDMVFSKSQEKVTNCYFCLHIYQKRKWGSFGMNCSYWVFISLTPTYTHGFREILLPKEHCILFLKKKKIHTYIYIKSPMSFNIF